MKNKFIIAMQCKKGGKHIVLGVLSLLQSKKLNKQ